MIDWLLPQQERVFRDFLKIQRSFLYGSVRSGKTEIQQYMIMRAVKRLPPGNILLVGNSQGSLYRNVIHPMIQKAPGSIAYNRATKTVRIDGRELWVEGADKADAVERIQGESLVGAFGDEVVTWNEEFFNMLLTRLSDEGAVFGGTMNPGPPKHFVKRYIDRADELGYGLDGRKEVESFLFLLEDNHFLSPTYRESIRKQYPRGTLWYDRYILGKWVAAEGAVFPFFSEDPKYGYVVNEIPGKFSRYIVGVDYGTTNPAAFYLAGQDPAGIWYIVKEYFFDSRASLRQKSDAQYVEDLYDFLKWEGARVIPSDILIDPSAASFIVAVEDAAGQGKPELMMVQGADNSVLDGIRDLISLLSAGRLKIYGPGCPELLEAMTEYVWDEKAALRGEDKPKKGGQGYNDHSIDAVRYLAREVMEAVKASGVMI